RSRVAVTLDVKLDIVKRHENGEGTSVIGRVHGLTLSMVHSIDKSANKIKEMAVSATPLTATEVTRFRDAEMEMPQPPPVHPKQNAAFRQLFKTSVKPQPSTSEPQPSTSEPLPSTSEPHPSTSEPHPSTSGEQQLSVKIDSDNE
ncbi:CENPB DNA-binding domain containing protein 1-like 33, partial [Homarus americanus]